MIQTLCKNPKDRVLVHISHAQLVWQAVDVMWVDMRAYKTSPLCQGFKNPRHQLAITTEFCTVVPNISGLSICNLLHVILLAPRILRCLARFCKICVPVHYTKKYLPLPPLILLLRWHYSPT